jgi:WD40 repeat protein
MTDDGSLDELVSVWQREKARGRDLPATEVCRDRPELAGELDRRLRPLRRMYDLAGPGAETVAPSEVATPAPGPGDTAPAGDGLRIPGYEVLATLGRGGMGVVYQARQTRLGRVVALKMILSGAHAGAADLARFRTEAEAIARLQHPNIVQIHEVGEHQGLPFFSLEYCPGGSLERKLGGTPLPAREAAALVEVLARAMQAAHAKGVIHRDLKPANVLLAEDGTPKVTDFGLAKKLDEAGQTATGAVMGTPSYMAPEQAGGRSAAIGPPCDVYALGAILYEGLTGRPPFRGPTTMETVMQVLADEPVPPTQLQPKTPRDLETICLTCLQKDPARRYPSAGALAEDLRRFQAGEPILARPVGRAERTWRWCKRKPALASLIALLLAVALGIIFGFPAMFGHELELRLRAEANAREARHNEEAADRALAGLEAEQRKTTGLLYAARINLSYREWQAGNAHRARQLLDDCPWDLRGWEWDYLKGLFDERSVVLNGHAGALVGVALTPDGRRAVTLGTDGTVRVWDARTGACLKQIDRLAHLLAVSPDGTRVAVAAEKGAGKPGSAPAREHSVEVVELETGRVVHSLRVDNRPLGLAFVRDGADLAVALVGGDVRFLDPAAGKERSRLGRRVDLRANTGPSAAEMERVTFSPDGRWLAQGGTEGKVRVWDGTTGELVLDEPAHLDYVGQVAFSPDGRRLASPGGDGDVRVWDLKSQQSVLRLTGHKSTVHCVAFSPDGRRLISGSKDTTVRVWDVETGENVLTLTGHASEVFGVAFAGGSRAASAGAEGTARVWDVDERVVYGPSVRDFFRGTKLLDPARRGSHEALTLNAYLGPVNDLAFSPDGHTLAAVGQPSPPGHPGGAVTPTVTIWDLNGLRLLRQLDGPHARAPFLAFSPDGRLLAVGTGSSKGDEPAELNVFDCATGQRVWHWDGPPGEQIHPAFAPGGARLTATLNGLAGDCSLITWDAASGKELLRHPLAGRHTRATWSPDGRALVTAGAPQGTIVIEKYDAETGQPQASWPAGTAGLSAVVCGPGGLVAAATSLGDRPAIKLFRVDDGREVASLEGHVGTVTGLAFSPDGRRLLSAGSDFAVRLWHTDSGRELLTFREHTDTITAVAWSPDGRWIGSAGLDRMIKLWQARDLHTAPSTDDWPVLFRDDLSRDGGTGDWEPQNGSWEIRGGVLCGRMVEKAGAGRTDTIAQVLRRKGELPRTAEVRLAYRAAKRVEMGVVLADMSGHGYDVMLCGGLWPYGEPCVRLLQVSEGQRYAPIGLARPFVMRTDHWHQVRVLREPERIRLYVDGREYLSERIPNVELNRLLLQGMWGSVGDEIEFKDVEVRAPADGGR